MLSLSQRLAESKKSNESMYSVDGAQFQEWAINRLDAKGSKAHQSIGRLVTDINNNRISVEEAKQMFVSLLNS